jgi:hypothetical protein
MTEPEHHNPEPPSEYTYAVGAGLGLLVGAAVGLFAGGDRFLLFAGLGIVAGLAVAYLVKLLRP